MEKKMQSLQWEHGVAPTEPTPRAIFTPNERHLTTMDFDDLCPIFWFFVNPNETYTITPKFFARLATPLHPIMDNAWLKWDWFWCPEKILWDNARKFRGEQINPGDSIAYTIPIKQATATTGYSEDSLEDWFGLPTKKPDYQHSAMLHRMYGSCWNHWYRDQNLQNSVTVDTGDGPDTTTNTSILKRNKAFDQFTSLLVAPQKNADGAIELPLGTSADIKYGTTISGTDRTDDWVVASHDSGGNGYWNYGTSAGVNTGAMGNSTQHNIYADLGNATAANVIAVRQALQIQKIVELDARIGTRLHEVIYGTFGIVLDNMEAYMPTYLGGGSAALDVNGVPSTYDDGTNNTTGDLGGVGTIYGEGGGFTKTFTEWGYIMCMVSAVTDLTYQQGLSKYLSLSTRYDFLHPYLQSIGDDVVYNIELVTEDPTTDTGSTGTADNVRVFGYRERYGFYKYGQKKITGAFRSNHTATLESWHFAQEFSAGVAFNSAFIECNSPVDRTIKVASEPHLIMDAYASVKKASPMHLYSIPGIGGRL